jgi:predicted NUDIX family NTP pyrophosphohydrolase
MIVSAGILPYRLYQGIEVYLGHMGGPYWLHKVRSWSIIKGEVDHDEDLLEAAKREFYEETGKKIEGKFHYLGTVKNSQKVLHVWGIETDLDTDIRSNTFEIEWPPHSGEVQSFPEIDRVQWFTLKEAHQVIVSYQEFILERLSQNIPLSTPTHLTR